MTRAAQALGVADPMRGMLCDVFKRTFARPVADSVYRTNRLQPGALPLEWSFSEVDPGALRIELQPFDPELPPEERLKHTITALLHAVDSRERDALASQLESRVANDLTECSHLEFGAFLGLVQRPDRSPEYKIYIELSPEGGVSGWNHLQNIAGATPHFRSIAVSSGKIDERTYFLCHDGLRLLDLESVCAELGMLHRFPGLLMTILELTDGEFYVPPRAVLLGFRHLGQQDELKVELVSSRAIGPDELFDRITRLLQPNAVRPFQRWATIVYPKQPRAPPVSIVSVKVSAERAPRLSVYAAEPWGQT